MLNSDKILCAAWFVLLALILALPLSIVRLSSIAELSIKQGICFVLLECLIPVALAGFFASRLGPTLCCPETNPSTLKSFIIGVKISVLSAIAWIFISFLSIVVVGLSLDALDAGRFLGTIVILAVFGFPVYGTLAGLGGIALRGLMIKRATTTD